MKVLLERALLLKALSRIHRVVERRNTIPILSNVALRAEGSSLRLKATDLDLEAVELVSARVEDDGATTVPAHMFYDIVRKLPEGAEVLLETRGEGTLAVEAGRTRFELQTLPESDFPDLTAGQFTHAFEMPVADLKRLIDRTQFAISMEETRYYLNGIFLHAVEAGVDARLRAVATDGHRLAKTEVPAPRGAEGMPGIIVPKKTVGEMQKLLDGGEAEVKVELSATKIRVSLGSVVLTSKLIDGTFPDYQRVIPQNNDKVMDVDRASFAAAVDRVSTVAAERGRAVKMMIAPERLVLSVTNPESGSATDELMADYDGPTIEIGFNSKYLLDITSQLETGMARFHLADAGAPTLIQDADGSDTLYVLMPMRV